MQFAKKPITKSPEFWKRAIWTNEAKFELFGTHRKQYAWCKPEKNIDPKYFQPTIKKGGSSVLVWGVFLKKEWVNCVSQKLQ